jgi:urease accessory protein
MPDCTISPDRNASHSAWQARLALRFADDGGVTRLVDKAHYGPLRVQKALYPEGGKVCHAIVVHPPGGVVGGDQLTIRADIGPQAHALISTPGAAKWYKANGKVSQQSVTLDVGAGAALEWLPQETIFFDTANVTLEQHIALAADATYIGCEILCMGRRASGESFNTGTVTQRTQVRRAGKLVWWEQGALIGGRLDSPLTLNGRSVCATLIAVAADARALPAQLLTAIRAEIEADGAPAFGISQTKGVLVARHLGDDSETARRLMLTVWRHLRPHLLQRAAVTPRIWQT